MNSSISPNTTLVTGATGFVGSHLVRRYLTAGQPVAALKRPDSDFGLLSDIAGQVTWVDGDILDIPSLELAIQPGWDVIHAAAVVSFTPKERDRMEKVNVEGTANVVNVCLKANVRKLGFISSVAALGRPNPKTGVVGQPIGINEEQKWEESPNNSFYAQTKYRAELEVWRGNTEGLNTVIVNPSLILGAGDWTKTSVRIFKYVYDEKSFYTDGLVNFVDVDDVADALFQLMTREANLTGRFIVNGGTIPYKLLFEEIAAAFGKRAPSVRIPPALTEVIWRVETVRSWLTGKAPLITRETAKSASLAYQFDGSKLAQALDFHYLSLPETLKRAVVALTGQAATQDKN